MVSIFTECGRRICCSLIDRGPRHRGWLGFDFVLQESSGLNLIEIQSLRDAAYLAATCGDDIQELLEQTRSGKVSWSNSDGGELSICGERKDQLYRLEFIAQGKSVRCNLTAASVECFVYSLGLERDKLLAGTFIGDRK